MKTIQELDLQSQAQRVITDVFKDEGYKNLAYLAVMRAMNKVASILSDLPPDLWERIVWEMNEKAKKSGSNAEKAKAQIFWHYLEAFHKSVEICGNLTDEECNADAKSDNLLKATLEKEDFFGVSRCSSKVSNPKLKRGDE